MMERRHIDLRDRHEASNEQASAEGRGSEDLGVAALKTARLVTFPGPRRQSLTEPGFVFFLHPLPASRLTSSVLVS